MKHFWPAIRINLFMAALLGLLYPTLITTVGRLIFPRQAGSELIFSGDHLVGSRWLGQSFEKQQYFWPRPSAVSYNPLPSGGSNLGPISSDLKKTVDERSLKLQAAHPEKGPPPQDLIFASGSGLDPEISPEAARYQVERVAKARGLDLGVVVNLLEQFIERPQLGLFGEARVNVLKLNLALDQLEGTTK